MLICQNSISKKYRYLLFCVLSLLMLSGCDSTELKSLKAENVQLKEQLQSVAAQRDEYKNQLDQANKSGTAAIPSVMYSQYEEKLRLVMKDTPLHLYFGNSAPVVNTINPYTAVTVLDAAMVNGEELWLYIEMPVYDIPAYFKGWIKESDTIKLTEENKKEAYDSVTVKNGVTVYNCDKVADIPKAATEVTTNDLRARIEKLQNGYAYVFTAGGWYFWVKEENIIYAYDAYK